MINRFFTFDHNLLLLDVNKTNVQINFAQELISCDGSFCCRWRLYVKNDIYNDFEINQFKYISL